MKTLWIVVVALSTGFLGPVQTGYAKASHPKTGHADSAAHAESGGHADPAAAHAEPGHGADASAHHAPQGMPAEAALKLLQAGNARYVSGKMETRVDPAARKELTKGQQPFAIVLSCSDSRVPTELVFDQGLGKVFTVRVAGNALGAAAVASIEYAAEHLGSQLLVVMGHESCGAVKAALEVPPTKTAGSPDLDTLLASIRPNLGKYGERGLASVDPAEAKTLRTPVRKNVEAVAAQLTERSKIIRHLVEKGSFKIWGGVYSLATGKVELWEAGD